MHRRYNRWHLRFDQPDPYSGSYDMTDPQSFNRYSYVQNDPVNFVDPLGLNPQDPQVHRRRCLKVHESRHRRLSPRVHWTRLQQIPGITGLEPQRVATLSLGRRLRLTTVMVRVVEADANRGLKSRMIALHLQTRLILLLRRRLPMRNSYQGCINGSQIGTIFVSLLRGFRPEFVDRGSSPNQVRHAVGAITAGHAGGVTAFYGPPGSYNVVLKATLRAVNEREYEYDSYTVTGAIAPGIPSTGYVRAPARESGADIALNGVAVPIGFNLGFGQTGRNEIGNLIRSQICNPTQ